MNSAFVPPQAGRTMAYDEGLAQRDREALEEQLGVDEKKMFGGICFLLYGTMACGILYDDIIVRVGTENYVNLLKLPRVRKFDFTGRPMKEWVVVSHEDLESDDDLCEWVRRGVDYALSLPLPPITSNYYSSNALGAIVATLDFMTVITP